MNCVPGMITEFSFTPPIYTTEEMRQNSDVRDKVRRTNEIRQREQLMVKIIQTLGNLTMC